MRPPSQKPGLKPSPKLNFIQQLAKFGYRRIVGVDEVGRGAIAGPVVVAAVELPVFVDGINDSKLLDRQTRTEISHHIRRLALQISFGAASEKEIDQLGLTAALALAYDRALTHCQSDLILTDNYRLKNLAHIKTIKGDQLFYPVAAASIVAKVLRDQQMSVYHRFYPEYGWCDNAGYGTAFHKQAVKKYGASPLHRQLFLS